MWLQFVVLKIAGLPGVSEDSTKTEESIISEPTKNQLSLTEEDKNGYLERNNDSGIVDESVPIEEFQNWNPMENDFTSERNSYEVDVDDAGVAAIGYKCQDEKLVCRFFSKGYVCHKGNTCKFKHIYTADRISTTDTIPAFTQTNELPLPEVNLCVIAEVTAIFNPGHFYVVLPYGNKSIIKVKQQGEVKASGRENLAKLMEAMQSHYSKHKAKPNPNIIPAIGELVAARYSMDCKWYRAKVVQTNSEENQVMVFFVDFGHTDWTFQTDIRDLEPQFHLLPHQAVECFMSHIEPIRRNERLSWSAAARNWFEEFVEGKQLVLRVLSSDQVVLYVELIDTNEEKHVTINEELVILGYAQYSQAALAPKLGKVRKETRSHEVIKVPG